MNDDELIDGSAEDIIEDDRNGNEMVTSVHSPNPTGVHLTLKQQLFADYYLGECYGNATEAARRAGYSGNDNQLATIGWQNLRKPEIRAYAKSRLDAVITSQSDVLREVWRVASQPMNTFMVVTKPATYDEDGTKLDAMHVRLDYTSKVRALELLMRYNRMLEDKAPVEVTVKALVGIDVSRI